MFPPLRSPPAGEKKTNKETNSGTPATLDPDWPGASAIGRILARSGEDVIKGSTPRTALYPPHKLDNSP